MNAQKKNHEKSQSKYSHKNVTLIFVAIALLVGVIALFSSGMMTGSSHSNMMGIQDHMITSEKQFIFEMIPHHQEAVDSSRIIFAKTQNSGVSRVADSIISGQTQEIEQMKNWTDNWYVTGYDTNYKKMMPDLRKYNGSDADDRRYLAAMVVHHQMAVMMAQQVLALKPRDEVVKFANNIITTQTAEIAFMNRILNN